jgi:hypothetical protein
LLTTGSLTIVGIAAGGTYVITGPAYFSGKSGTGATIASDQKSAAGDGSNAPTFTITPTGAAGSTFTVAGYTSSALTTLTDLLSVTIAGTSVSGVVSVADSGVFWNTSAAEVTADASGASAVAPVTAMYLDIDLEDAYGTAITTAGALVVTASAGAYVGIGTSPSTGTFATAVSGADPSGEFVKVTEATAGAGWKGTVTVTYNGVVVATKSGSIAGYASKITLSRNKVATAATSTTDAIRFKAVDSAGSSVQITAASLTMKSSSNTSVVSNVVGATAENITAGSLDDGKATVTCGTPGTSSVVMQYITPAGVTVVTAPITVICGSTADTYTASWDKASYAQGEIAQLTVSFKDVYGAPAASASAVTALVSSLSNEVISAPMMTLIGSVSAAALYPDANGQLVYSYSVGTSTGVTPGAYQASISFPTVNSANGAAQAVGYTVTAGAGVTNADVLKAIVSLIASINKQIAALQKALLKR